LTQKAQEVSLKVLSISSSLPSVLSWIIISHILRECV
jgi:hypothetical protein